MMYTIRYGFLYELEADDILEPSEVPDAKLSALLTRTDEFLAVRHKNTVTLVRRDQIKSISTHVKGIVKNF